MKLLSNPVHIFLFVTVTALTGMALGGVFGYLSGHIAPEMFTHIFLGEEYEPIGAATVMGAFGGVLCGGGLGTFAIIIQAITYGRGKSNTPR